MKISTGLTTSLFFLSAAAAAVPDSLVTARSSHNLTKRSQCYCDSGAATRDCCNGLGTMGGDSNLECVPSIAANNDKFLSCCFNKGFIGNVCF
ncbi:hypothetical protein CDEST_15233 [Colletotrichum destructivum]|uniref:Uncharacterized protein n=1 Tax=Colletotrichum destructivum TaxID=34406 RepID=A0AAX4J3T0_9PEZI|nr:hypothetical protein CDEST_15233 [Colletotrichum destructivum]